MKSGKLVLYTLAWIAYSTFCFALFPLLKITVMLFSIPLTMLGGWFYSYKGAIFTTLLTIPLHHLIFNCYSDVPKGIHEALNPFGIVSQLVFSLSAAFLKKTQQRYEHLNSTLESMVEERTRSHALLASQLVESKNSEVDTAEAELINEPLRHLGEILETSRHLSLKLADDGHPAAETSDAMAMLINTSMEQLNRLGQRSKHRLNAPQKDYTTIHQLTQDFANLAGDKAIIDISGNWEALAFDVSHHLFPIIHEALTNAVRHATPSRVTIDIQFDADTIVVSIGNDGDPLPPGIQEGMGIPLMRYHAQRMGATLSVQTCGREQNTVVKCVIPVRAQ